MDDPYLYPETYNVLRNKEDIREPDALERFERMMTAQRISEGLPNIEMTAAGYRRLHHHLFQDVYDWAGQDRTIDLGKTSWFCRPQNIERELDKRFEAINAEHNLRGLNAEQFTTRAAEHICELNAIHPFREGNGRTQRAFLDVLARQAGHEIDMQRINPQAWNDASIMSFHMADYGSMREVIAGALVEGAEHARSQVTLDAIKADPWNAVKLDLPANANGELLDATLKASQLCAIEAHGKMEAARAGTYIPPGYTSGPDWPDVHEPDENRWLRALDRIDEINARREQERSSEREATLEASTTAEKDAKDLERGTSKEMTEARAEDAAHVRETSEAQTNRQALSREFGGDSDNERGNENEGDRSRGR